MEIPVIDFTECFPKDEMEISEMILAEVGTKLYKTFAGAGFAFITNTGITRDEVHEIDQLSLKFFSQTNEEKMEYYNYGELEGLCYDPIGSRKSHNKNIKKPDYVEGFRISPLPDDYDKWPNIQGFQDRIMKFKEKCKFVGLRVFRALGIGMKLKDKDMFYKSHKSVNSVGNPTTLKLLNYPAITDDVVLEEGQIRFPEHTDFGTLTFLFSDDLSGLQIKDSRGEYQHIPDVPNSILINVGDELQHWTGGRLKSTSHRVVVPSTREQRLKPRRSMAFFFIADNDILLDKLEFDDEKEYTVEDWIPMTSRKFIEKRFIETYY